MRLMYRLELAALSAPVQTCAAEFASKLSEWTRSTKLQVSA